MDYFISESGNKYFISELKDYEIIKENITYCLSENCGEYNQCDLHEYFVNESKNTLLIKGKLPELYIKHLLNPKKILYLFNFDHSLFNSKESLSENSFEFVYHKNDGLLYFPCLKKPYPKKYNLLNYILNFCDINFIRDIFKLSFGISNVDELDDYILISLLCDLFNKNRVNMDKSDIKKIRKQKIKLHDYNEHFNFLGANKDYLCSFIGNKLNFIIDDLKKLPIKAFKYFSIHYSLCDLPIARFCLNYKDKEKCSLFMDEVGIIPYDDFKKRRKYCENIFNRENDEFKYHEFNDSSYLKILMPSPDDNTYMILQNQFCDKNIHQYFNNPYLICNDLLIDTIFNKTRSSFLNSVLKISRITFKYPWCLVNFNRFENSDSLTLSGHKLEEFYDSSQEHRSAQGAKDNHLIIGFHSDFQNQSSKVRGYLIDDLIELWKIKGKQYMIPDYLSSKIVINRSTYPITFFKKSQILYFRAFLLSLLEHNQSNYEPDVIPDTKSDDIENEEQDHNALQLINNGFEPVILNIVRGTSPTHRRSRSPRSRKPKKPLKLFNFNKDIFDKIKELLSLITEPEDALIMEFMDLHIEKYSKSEDIDKEYLQFCMFIMFITTQIVKGWNIDPNNKLSGLKTLNNNPSHRGPLLECIYSFIFSFDKNPLNKFVKRKSFCDLLSEFKILNIEITEIFELETPLFKTILQLSQKGYCHGVGGDNLNNTVYHYIKHIFNLHSVGDFNKWIVAQWNTFIPIFIDFYQTQHNLGITLESKEILDKIFSNPILLDQDNDFDYIYDKNDFTGHTNDF
jgi:hypothetical protein